MPASGSIPCVLSNAEKQEALEQGERDGSTRIRVLPC